MLIRKGDSKFDILNKYLHNEQNGQDRPIDRFFIDFHSYIIPGDSIPGFVQRSSMKCRSRSWGVICYQKAGVQRKRTWKSRLVYPVKPTNPFC